jgi:hypothetical protein
VDALLSTINALRAVPPAPWRDKVRRVAVILTSSRSGSSLFKEALTRHPDIAALDGEMVPFLTLSGNGFGQDPACSSDAITHLRHADALANYVFDGLTVASRQLAPQAELHARWCRRLLLQFPALFAAPDEYARLQHSLGEALAYVCGRGDQLTQREAVQVVLGGVFWRERWRIDYYDGRLGPGEAGPFAEAAKIEEPPFVQPVLRRRRCIEADISGKVLLFKTPSDAYRPGLYQQLFPQAEIRYIHLTRGYAQSVNGLIDGWLSQTGFFAHDMAHAGIRLQIGGYSERFAFGQRWWKFDLPPNWREFTSASLEDVCLNQWLSCHRHILHSGLPMRRIAFEDFLADPTATLAQVCKWLELGPAPAIGDLPVTMATEAPTAGRWHKRHDLLLPMVRRTDVAQTMRELGYRLEPESWQ